MCPPSSTGMGNRFMMPSCSEIMAIRNTTSIQPRRSISPEIRAMEIGPLSSFTLPSARNSRPSVTSA